MVKFKLKEKENTKEEVWIHYTKEFPVCTEGTFVEFKNVKDEYSAYDFTRITVEDLMIAKHGQQKRLEMDTFDFQKYHKSEKKKATERYLGVTYFEIYQLALDFKRTLSVSKAEAGQAGLVLLAEKVFTMASPATIVISFFTLLNLT